MRISFIICYSSTWPMTVFDKRDWPEIKPDLDQAILSHTNKLIDQILSVDLNVEIILIDNSGDFKLNTDDDRVKVLDGLKVITNLEKRNQAEVTAMAYNLGIEAATGDYFIIQHNDIWYLDNYYPMHKLLTDAIGLLEEDNLQYITIDAKPKKKVAELEGSFFADCYWFLCRNNFYSKHNIDIGYELGDNNHDATKICREKNLKFLHLPGYYEVGLGRYYRDTLRKNYPGLNRIKNNIHSFNEIPFLVHVKGGTGLKNFINHYDIIN